MYAAIGGLAGAVLDRLAATYLILFLAMTDLGIVQNPMFGTPHGGAVLLPGYGPGRVMVDGAFSGAFHAGGDLLLSLAWIALLAVRSSLSFVAWWDGGSDDLSKVLT